MLKGLWLLVSFVWAAVIIGSRLTRQHGCLAHSCACACGSFSSRASGIGEKQRRFAPLLCDILDLLQGAEHRRDRFLREFVPIEV